MTTSPESQTTPTPIAAAAEDAGFEVLRADAVLAGRAMSSGEHLAGLVAAAMLDTAGRPDRLPADLFPGVDPVVVQTIWDRALAVGLRAGRFSSAPRFHRDALARLQGELAAAGHHAMGGLVGRSLRVVGSGPVHPADHEPAREHGGVDG